MTKKEKEEIEYLVNLKAADMPEKQAVLNYIRKYINEGARFCLTCPASVRLMFSQLRDWWNKQNTNLYQFIKTKK